MNQRFRILLVLLSLNAPAGMAFADTMNGTGPVGSDPGLIVNAGWYGFCFAGAPGSPATAGCQNEGVGVVGNDITLTAVTRIDLNITDAFETGDSFQVYVDGSLALTTPSVPPLLCGPIPDCGNPDEAFASPAYSHGTVALGPGSYTVDIYVENSPYPDGAAYVEAISAVPEPSSILLLLTVLACIGAAVRLRAGWPRAIGQAAGGNQ